MYEKMTISEMRARIIDRATVDNEFRARLVADPKAAIKTEIGVDVPSGFTVQIHEDTEKTNHLILPPSAALSEADLDEASGGDSFWSWWD